MSTEFNPAEVAAWLRAELAKLDTTGLKHASLQITTATETPIFALAYEEETWASHSGYGITAADAWAKLREKIPTGEMLVKKKLADIATLEAEIRDLQAKAEKAEATT